MAYKRGDNRMHRKLPRILHYLLTVCVLWHSSSNGYDHAFLSHVITHNINTLSPIEIKPPYIEPATSSLFDQFIRPLYTSRELSLKNLSNRDKRAIIFEQIQQQLNESDTVIDTFFIEKMAVVHGASNPTDHLLNHLFTDLQGTMLLATEIGAKRCIEIMTQPTTNLQDLAARQTIIKELVQNDALRTQCNQLLKKIKHGEPYFFELYSKQGLEKSEQSLLKFQSLFTQLGWHNITALTLSTRFMQLLQLVGSLSLLLFILSAASNISYQTIQYTKRKDLQTITNDLSESLKMYAVTTPFSKRVTDARQVATEAIFLCTAPFEIFIGLNALKEHIDQILNIQEILIGFGSYLDALTILIHLFNNNPSIKQAMPQLTKLCTSLHHPEGSAPFKELNTILKKDDFTQATPSPLSSPGNILTAYHHIAQPIVRAEYSTMLNTLGEIDTYVALANKIKIHQNNADTCAQFCFVEFQENALHPQLIAKNFWNPFIGYKKTICNDISLNIGNERNVILTGTNTGGKSTLLKAIIIALFLALTFGIAPGESLITTLWYKLIISMNIVDDISADLSLFKAEVKRAHEIIRTIQQLPPHQFAFVVSDEIFRGTAHDKGEKLAFNYMQYLNTFKNCLFITATHFEKLTALEKITNGEIKNYHMSVDVDENGTIIKYNHKLVPGPSPIVNAEQIAEELLLDYIDYVPYA